MYSIIKCYLRHILAVCVVSLCVMTGTAASSVKLDVDWPQFMSKQDMVWETLPEYWYESAYMGNGMLGLWTYGMPRLLPTLSLQKEKFIYIVSCIAIR